MPNVAYDPPKDFRTEAQKAIDSTVKEIETTIGKVGRRGENLQDLEERSSNLASTAHVFRGNANVVRKRECIKEYKWKLIVGLGIIALIALIVIPVAVTQSKKD